MGEQGALRVLRRGGTWGWGGDQTGGREGGKAAGEEGAALAQGSGVRDLEEGGDWGVSRGAFQR